MNRILLLLLFLFPGLILPAADWPNFNGPGGNDHTEASPSFSPDLSKWKKTWEVNVGLGYSAVSVVDGLAFTMGHDGKETETIYCVDAAAGRIKWKYSYNGKLINKLHPGGPNSTPAIEGEFVYALSKDGQAFCLDKSTGKLIWKRNILETMGTELPSFGFACSPVIYKDWVLYTSGKALAVNKKSGAVVWLSKDVDKDEKAYHPGHATPVVFENSGNTYVTFLLGTGLEILNIKDGSRVARHNLTADYNMTATSPTVLNDGKNILISWNKYSEMLSFDGRELGKVWKSGKFTHTMQNSILIDGVLFGCDGKERGKRITMNAIEADSGKFLWTEKFQWSQITVIGDVMLCMTVDGDLVTLKVSAEKLVEISRKKILDNICWTKATYAGNRIFTRNDKGRFVCYSM